MVDTLNITAKQPKKSQFSAPQTNRLINIKTKKEETGHLTHCLTRQFAQNTIITHMMMSILH